MLDVSLGLGVGGQDFISCGAECFLPRVSNVTNWMVSNFNSHADSWDPCISAGGMDTAEFYQQTGQKSHNNNKNQHPHY